MYVCLCLCLSHDIYTMETSSLFFLNPPPHLTDEVRSLTLIPKVPVHYRHGDEVLQALQLPGNDCTGCLYVYMRVNIDNPVKYISLSTLPPPQKKMRNNDNNTNTYPRTGIADIQVIAALLSGELGAGLVRDPLAERADLALELARLVVGIHPVRDLTAGRHSRLRIVNKEWRSGYCSRYCKTPTVVDDDGRIHRSAEETLWRQQDRGAAAANSSNGKSLLLCYMRQRSEEHESLRWGKDKTMSCNNDWI